MKRRWFIFSLRTLFVVAILVGVTLVVVTWKVGGELTQAVTQPSVQICLGSPRPIIAPEGSATAGSEWIEFPVRLANTGKRSMWLEGYSASRPFYQIFTRPLGSKRWIDRGVGFCGTGAGMHLIDLDTAVSFAIAVPAAYAGKQICVTVNVCGEEDGSLPVRVTSTVVDIPQAP